MTLPLHVGIEHPNALWLVAVGVLSFAAGAGVMLRSKLRPDDEPEAVTNETDA